MIEGDFQAPNWLDLQRLHHNPREHPPKGLRTRDIYVPDLHIDIIKAKSRNFH